MEELNIQEREVLEVLRRRGGSMNLYDLLQICNLNISTLKALEQKGQIAVEKGWITMRTT